MHRAGAIQGRWVMPRGSDLLEEALKPFWCPLKGLCVFKTIIFEESQSL